MGKKILVVDDSSTARQQIGGALAEGGYDILEAADGVDAVTKLDEVNDVSLVICDVNMPRMNGLEFLRNVKQSPVYSEVPVLMLTTDGRPGPIAEAKQAGAKGWMVKPFKPNLLLAAVKKLTGEP